MASRAHIHQLLFDQTRKGLHCPWIDETEWKTVCSWLYGNETDERRKGVARVAAWRARGIIPFPIESTVDIVQCLLKEETEGEVKIDEALCLMYSMAITRFINGMTDYGWWQGGHGNISNIVGVFGIPYWLVELRHDGTHRALPSRSTLRRGAEFAYQWLWTNYWRPQYTSLPKNRMEGPSQPTIVEWFTSEKTTPTKLPPSLEQEGMEEVKKVKTDITDVDEVVRHAINEYITGCKTTKLKSIYRLLAKAHVNDLVILMKWELFLHPLKEEDSVLYNVPVKTTLAGFPCLSVSLYNTWKPLLQRMGRYLSSTKSNLLHSLITVMHSPSTNPEWSLICAGWIGTLLSVSIPVNRTNNGSCIDLTDDDLMEGEVHWKELMELTLNNPGPYSYALMIVFMTHLSSLFHKQKLEDILHLSALITVSYRNTTSLPSLPYSSHLLSENRYDKELNELLVQVGVEHEGTSNKTNLMSDDTNDMVTSEYRNQWKIAEGNWYSCPLGQIPGGKPLTPLSLDLPPALDYCFSLPSTTEYPLTSTQFNDPPPPPPPPLVIVSSTEEEQEEEEEEEVGGGTYNSQTICHSHDISSVQLQMIQQCLSLY